MTSEQLIQLLQRHVDKISWRLQNTQVTAQVAGFNVFLRPEVCIVARDHGGSRFELIGTELAALYSAAENAARQREAETQVAFLSEFATALNTLSA